MESESVRRMIETAVREIVDRPEDVEVTAIDGTQSTVLEVSVARADHGRLLGRKGATVDALRQLLLACSGKYDRRFVLEVLE